ncbi:MAG: hypothetical protein ACXWPM_08715 [Bdellovibrionota bacterium]
MNSSRMALVTVAWIAWGCAPSAKTPDSAHFQYTGPGQYQADQGEISFPKDGPHDSYTLRDTTSPHPSTPRQNYSMIDVPQETDPVFLKHFLQKLAGKWKRDRVVKDSIDLGVAGDQITFDQDKHTVTLSAGGFSNEESISYKRVCISKELYRDDAYFGFRVVEFEADNNEGIAAFGIRLDAPSLGHTYPTLLTTERVYSRWGQRDALETVDAVFGTNRNDEAGTRIIVYPSRP